MTIRAAITLFVATLIATTLCATSARAEARDKDLDCPDQMTLVEDGVVPALAEIVVPCAMVDSGVLGADCHDAAFYVVNQTGTLLCRLEIMVLGFSTSSASLDDSQPASATIHIGAVAAAVASVVDIGIGPPGITDLPRAAGAVLIGPADDHVSFSPRPS